MWRCAALVRHVALVVGACEVLLNEHLLAVAVARLQDASADVAPNVWVPRAADVLGASAHSPPPGGSQRTQAPSRVSQV